MADQMAEIQETTLNKFLAAWEDWSSEGQIAFFTEDVKQRTLPFSLRIPSRSRDEIQATLPRLEEIVTNYKVSYCTSGCRSMTPS